MSASKPAFVKSDHIKQVDYQYKHIAWNYQYQYWLILILHALHHNTRVQSTFFCTTWCTIWGLIKNIELVDALGWVGEGIGVNKVNVYASMAVSVAIVYIVHGYNPCMHVYVAV